MNIQREFLSSDSAKYIPLQLLTSNYGVAETHPSGTLPTDTENVHITEVIFPVDSSNLVFLLDFATKDVVRVYASPPGTITVNLEIVKGKEYTVYVVSKEYVDGFINGSYQVSTDFLGNQLRLNFDENPPTTIDLTKDGAMTKSKGRDDRDPTQWYNYTGSYNSETLVWSSPIAGDIQLTTSNYWLILRQEILVQVENIFSQVNLTSFNVNNKNDPMKMLQVMDDIAEFMRDKKDYYDEILGDDKDKVADIWGFLNSSLPGYEYNQLEFTGDRYYWAFDDQLGNIVDELGIYADYIRWDGFNAMGDDTSPIANSRDQQGRYVAASNMGINHGGPGYIPGVELDLAGLTDDRRHKGTLKGGKDGRSYIAGGWDAHPWKLVNDPQWGVLWDSFQSSKVPFIERENPRMGDVFGLPIHGYGEDTLTAENRAWWSGVFTYTQAIWDNVRPWLTEKLTANRELMAKAGDSLWSGYTFQDYVLVGYADFDPATPRPTWFNTSVKWTLEKYSNTDRTYAFDSEGYYEPDYIWDRLKSLGYLGTRRDSWNPLIRDMDLDGSDYGFESNRTGNRIPTHKSSDWFPLVEFVTQNLDKIYAPIYETISGGTFTGQTTGTTSIQTGTTGTTTGTTRTYPQAQEAILQNIRFVKNLIQSMDENMWSSITNSSALMLSTMLGIKADIEARPETHSILNLTNSTVKNENIEVVWKKIGSTDWTPLETTLEDAGNGVKMINLSTDSFTGIGKYIILVRPVTVRFDISRTVEDYAIVYDVANENRAPNSYYGFNVQLYTPNNELQGGQKIVVESKWQASEQWLKLTPLIQGNAELTDDLKIEMWSNEFIPVMVEVDVVEHNALTLSYAAYGEKELYTNSGKCIIYDYNGNVYKTLTLGRYSNASTGNEIVEYRSPRKDPH